MSRLPERSLQQRDQKPLRRIKFVLTEAVDLFSAVLQRCFGSDCELPNMEIVSSRYAPFDALASVRTRHFPWRPIHPPLVEAHTRFRTTSSLEFELPARLDGSITEAEGQRAFPSAASKKAAAFSLSFRVQPEKADDIFVPAIQPSYEYRTGRAARRVISVPRRKTN